MKKLLSIILAITMIAALIPSAFAAGEIELDLDELTAKTNVTTGADKLTLTQGSGIVSVPDMSVRRYGTTNINGSFLALSFSVDTAGEYKLSFKTDATGIDEAGAAPAVYIVEKELTDSINAFYLFKCQAADKKGYFDFSKLSTVNEYVPMTIGTSGETSGKPITVDLKANTTYTMVFHCDATSLNLNNVTTNDKVDLAVYDCDSTGVRTIDKDVALPDSYEQKIRISGIKFTPANESSDDPDITDAFETETPTSTVYNPTVSGAGYNASEGMATVDGITKTLQSNGSYKMYAPEKNGDAQFLYWAKGLSAYKKIVSYENEFYYTPAGGDNNILIAVYDEADGTSNKAEFYNANGQLIKLITDETVDKKVPDLPSMAGYNNASSWKQYNGETVANAGENIEPSGTMIFVAQYESEKPLNVTVTVEHGNGTATVPYGEVVTCTPDASKGELKWWKKEINGVSEIVSIDETYSFRAWETCTVTAEYDTKKPVYTGSKMKIIIDSFKVGNTENGVMAEFIGFGADTVEKGIIYNGMKIAMTKPGTQFTVTGELNDTFKGYAIVKNGTTYNLIVDGEVTLTNAE
ncbi:MAG: hypothetical protein E7441_05610 [Ruminococcaceae bacterium]|nr:hypothetical protein [Oscillospiraceae bacterium]